MTGQNVTNCRKRHQSGVATSVCHHANELDLMINAGCELKEQGAAVLAFGRTEALAESLKQLVVSELICVDAFSYSAPLEQVAFIGSAKAIIIGIDTARDFNEVIEFVTKIRLQNLSSQILIVYAYSGTIAKVECYLAGADHCIKLPFDHGEQISLLSETFKDIESESKVKLVLDQARLCLYGLAKKLEVSYSEMQILYALMNAKEYILSHDDVAKVLDLNLKYYDPRALEKTMSRLRGKIRKTYDINAIHNVRGFGYRLCRGVIS